MYLPQALSVYRLIPSPLFGCLTWAWGPAGFYNQRLGSLKQLYGMSRMNQAYFELYIHEYMRLCRYRYMNNIHTCIQYICIYIYACIPTYVYVRIHINIDIQRARIHRTSEVSQAAKSRRSLRRCIAPHSAPEVELAVFTVEARGSEHELWKQRARCSTLL